MTLNIQTRQPSSVKAKQWDILLVSHLTPIQLIMCFSSWRPKPHRQARSEHSVQMILDFRGQYQNLGWFVYRCSSGGCNTGALELLLMSKHLQPNINKPFKVAGVLKLLPGNQKLMFYLLMQISSSLRRAGPITTIYLLKHEACLSQRL